ncbi:MAG TPA: hypothetical protein VD839_04625 [Burkholderiales bacterium]|nr:hypothetical protein [Burkholderiales bacterium]
MRLIIAAAILAVAATAHGQVMKCVRADGSVEYANRCPAGTSEHRTTISTKTSGSTTPAPTPAAQKSLAEREAAFKKRQTEQNEEAQKAQKVATETAQKKQACEGARNYLKMIESGERLRTRDPKTGEIGYIDDAGRAAEEARARKAVQDYCS